MKKRRRDGLVVLEKEAFRDSFLSSIFSLSPSEHFRYRATCFMANIILYLSELLDPRDNVFPPQKSFSRVLARLSARVDPLIPSHPPSFLPSSLFLAQVRVEVLYPFCRLSS